MISLKLTETKKFMSQLLLSELFDHFLFIEGDIVTFNSFHIDGYIQKDFYAEFPPEELFSAASSFSGSEALPEYSYWKQVREYCFSLIKGKRTPLSFKFVFRLSPANITKLIAKQNLDFQPNTVQGLYLNIQFNEQGLTCVTGTSLNTFTLDKSLEKAWDGMVQRFFTKNGVAFEVAI